MRRVLVQILAVLALVGSAYAQRVELQIEAKTIEEGDTVEMTLICSNTGDPETPKFEVPEGLQLRYVNTKPNSSSMVSIVNGRRTDTTTHTYSLRLTGLKAGSYVIPAATFQAGGATYQTQPVSIVVTKTASDAKKDGDRLVFARIAAQPTSLYVTQTIDATLTLGIRKFERDGQPVELGNLLQLVDANGSELSVFGTRFSPSELTLLDSQGNRHEYLIYRQSKEIRADQVGKMRIGPVSFKVNYPVSLRRSIFGGQEVAQSRREIARSPAVEIEVKGPPDEGKPFDFSGAIGNYEFKVSAKPERVEQGQPVTLTMAIKGDPLDGVAGPDLKRFPELAARFDFSAEESPGEKEGNTKVFRRAIFPRREGEQAIPPISWSYFDPDAHQYVSVTSDPIPIVVDPATSLHADGGTEMDAANGATKLTRTGGGITPNEVRAARALINHDVGLQPALIGAVLVCPPALCLCVMLVTWRGAKLRSDANFLRRRGALRRATSRIREAAAESSKLSQTNLLAEAVTGYIADRFGLPPGAMTSAEAEGIIVERTGNREVAAKAAAFLSSCDAARFAGGASAGLSAAGAAKEASEIVERLERIAS